MYSRIPQGNFSATDIGVALLPLILYGIFFVYREAQPQKKVEVTSTYYSHFLERATHSSPLLLLSL